MTTEPTQEARPLCSIVIPSLDGYRDGCVPALLASIEAQTFRDYEVHVIKGVSPQGRAINEGAAKARGAILVIVDDDSCLADDSVLQRLVDVIEADPDVGMAGASIVLSPDATRFQQRAARQFPRLHTPVVEEVTDSDLACHGCCAIPVEVFNEVGREREDILRGLDPDLRVRLRKAGRRVVLAPHTRIYHPLPDGWRQLMRLYFRNGFGSAYARKFKPETVYETQESLNSESFRPHTSLWYRMARFPFRLARAVLGGKFLRFSAYVSYGLGYAWGSSTGREIATSPSQSSPKTLNDDPNESA
jgi:glycosyltransferase involved in cell wall biosynthesis